MKKNEDFVRNVPCTEEMIPVERFDNAGEEIKPISVLVDGNLAKCFITSPPWLSTKIVLLFDEPNLRWGDSFTTKHFRFVEPGKMQWGHNGEHMRILC